MSLEMIRLGEVAAINPRRLQIDLTDADMVTFVPMEAVDETTGAITASRPRPFGEVKKGYTVFADGDVIFAKVTPCMQNGKHAIAHNLLNGLGFGSTEFHVVRPGPRISSEWIHYFLRRQETLDAAKKTINGAVGLQRVPSSFLEEVELLLPDIDAQRRITTNLKIQFTALEKARQAAQAQLADAKRLIPAILSATFDNLTDAEWVPIGDVARTTSGTTPSRGQKNLWEPPLYPWVKTGEVAFKVINQTEESVSAKALAECSLTLLPAGTVLVAMYGQGKTRGQSAVLNVAATTNQACFAILPSKTLDPEYLQFWLRRSYEALRSLSDSRGGNQSNLNGALMNAFEVPLLPLEEQKTIARHIKQAIANANALEQTIEQQLRDIELLPSRLLAQVFGAPPAVQDDA